MNDPVECALLVCPLLVCALFLLYLGTTTTCYTTKPDPVGGVGGQLFDSGINFSGVKSVKIRCGRYLNDHYLYKSTIKRVFVTFEDNDVFNDDMKNDIYQGQSLSHSSRDGEVSFNVSPDDPIVKIVVWTDGTLANAVQFQAKSGVVSQLYGAPPNGAKPHEFQGDQLVGVYGAFGDAMDSLGFSFASHCTQDNTNGGKDTAQEEFSATGTSFGTDKSQDCMATIAAKLH